MTNSCCRSGARREDAEEKVDKPIQISIRQRHTAPSHDSNEQRQLRWSKQTPPLIGWTPHHTSLLLLPQTEGSEPEAAAGFPSLGRSPLTVSEHFICLCDGSNSFGTIYAVCGWRFERMGADAVPAVSRKKKTSASRLCSPSVPPHQTWTHNR